MSLRLRFALLLFLLAAFFSTTAAVVSYAVTTTRIDQEVDVTLQGYADRFSDPDGNLARALCVTGAEASAAKKGDGDDDDLEQNFRGLPGVTIQCVKTDGTIINSLGPGGVPVVARDATVITGQSAPVTEHLKGADFRVLRLPSPTGDIIRISRSLEETDHVLDSVRNRLAALGLGSALIAGVLGLILAKRAVRPITRLTKAAEDVASTGDLSVVLPKAGVDEIGRLSRAFGGMMAALSHSRDQQQQLVQDAGHELRTPLSSLRTNIDTLRRYPDLAGTERDHLLTDLNGELIELSTVVDELLSLASDSHGEPDETIDLNALVTPIVDRISRRTGREIVVNGSSGDVLAKPYLVNRAISNLIENAVKFSSPNQPIDVAIGQGVVAVRDYGPGISESDMEQVFERFYRSPAARSLPGSGLGLAIVRQIMERSGGSVTVSNHADGGAVFVLQFVSAGVSRE